MLNIIFRVRTQIQQRKKKKQTNEDSIRSRNIE